MATRRWLGTAKNVTQVTTVTIASAWTAGDTITVTINNISATVTIGSLTTTAQVATTLYQAWEGVTFTDTTAASSPTIADGGFKSIPEFYELTASAPSASVVTLTARTSGKPITVSVTESTVSTGTATGATATTATGKKFWSNTSNWSGSTVPVNGDDIVYDTGDVDCSYGIDTAIQPASVTVTMGYTGKIGLAETNADDSGRTYREYRTRYLTFDNNAATTATLTVGQGTGQGSRRMRFDFGAGRVTALVYNTGTRNETDMPTLILLGSHASNDLTIEGGDVGSAVIAGETATWATARNGNDGSTQGPSCVLGSGCTLTTVVSSSGYLQLNSNSTTLTMTGANAVVDYVLGRPATLLAYAGTVKYRSSTTISTALTIGSLATFDRSGENRSLTITPLVNMYKGAKLLDPNSSITFTAGIKANGCKMTDITVDVGFHRTYTVA